MNLASNEIGSSKPCVLAINGGSSSIKFAVYAADESLKGRLYGTIDRIGLSGTNLAFYDMTANDKECQSLLLPPNISAVNFFIDWIEDQESFELVSALGHRVVHGMEHSEPKVVTEDLLEELREITPYDPEHLPGEIELMEMFLDRHPDLPQVACFDTSFHNDLPRVAQLLPIPRRYNAKGLRRYGFHGLSYSFLMEELARQAGDSEAQGRVILAHLGSGASLAAVRDGKPIDTSMSFSPTSGVPMSTRSGDLDPGIFWYLARTEKMSAEQFYEMVNSQSGLLGISETSSDMRELLSYEGEDDRAAEAVALFCYQVRKWVGSFAAALGGLDTLIFAGGIGENAPLVRAQICADLEFLGIEIDEKQNTENEGIISTAASEVTVRVIHTNEELMIAQLSCRVLGMTGVMLTEDEEQDAP